MKSFISYTHVILASVFCSRTTEIWKSLAALDTITQEVLTAWQQKGIDVIIAPGFAFPAPPVKHPARLIPALSYTAGYNVLDFPVGTVPITRVLPQDEVKRSLFSKAYSAFFGSPTCLEACLNYYRCHFSYSDS